MPSQLLGAALISVNDFSISRYLDAWYIKLILN